MVADESKALHVIAQMKQGRVVNLREDIALKAAMISIRNKLPMADSIIYATGLIENAIIWTQDQDFKGLSGVNFREVQKDR